MPWFHVPSLSLGGDAIPELACYHDECYIHSSHSSRRRVGISVPRMTLDNPCRHMHTFTDAEGEMYLWAHRVSACMCGCGGMLLTPSTDWNYNLDLSGAYFSPGIPQGLSVGAFLCYGCSFVYPSGDHGQRTFTNPMDDEATEAHYCGACARRQIHECGDCATEYLNRDMSRLSTRDGEVHACTDCASSYTRCTHCNYVWQPDTREYCCNSAGEDNNDYMEGCGCYTCEHLRRNMSRVIKNYSYKPAPDFRSIGPEVRRDRYGLDATPYLGFELEVEVDRNHNLGTVAQTVQNGLGDVAYLKDDGSIDSGFEIVTHPMTLDYAMTQFNWRVLRDQRRSRTLFTASNCGLHVHVSKAGFSSKAHEYRWLLFWHRNQIAMRSLADRDSHYAKYDADHRANFASIVKGSGDYSERYSAINTNNPYTHEVRVFASTLFVNRLKASLQLVEATVEYTRILASAKVMHDGGFSWHEFVVWLTSNARRYAELLERIRAVVKVSNDTPIIDADNVLSLRRGRNNGYANTWIAKPLIIQEKATA